ncbi:TPA: hypothetical protein NEQ81_006489 [Pseudomonas aeruginosa]|uniref:hypothetical protein n=1 Tax=Pseudomonas aeruginosa TaxID=287 RepID=UPI0035682B72|nr:hypothetical protein [Pseudomonas aeruginosa]HCE0608076.1 hypothetical protein [Pseudomonas aeruginosa]
MADDDSPELFQFKQHAASSKAGRSEVAGNVAISKVGFDLDTTFNFRLNSGLKAEFERLCKLNHTNSAREIKRFMTEAIRAQRLI